MFDYKVMSKDQRKWMLYLLVIIALGAIFTPYTRFFLGLLLGTAISFYNLWLLQRKVYAFGKAVVETGAPLGLGTFTRIVTSVLGVVVALRFEQFMNPYAVVIGLATSYVVLLVDSFVRAVWQARRED